MTNYKTVRIGDVSTKIFSGGTPSTKIDEYWNGEFNWMSSGETRNAFITKTDKTITELGVKESSTSLSKPGDILVASAGQGFTRGQTSLNMIDTFINQSIISIRINPEKADNIYVYYNIKSRYNELRQLSDGHSIRGSLTTKMFNNLEIRLPNLCYQKKVGQLLFDIDKKIETNNKINENFEELAQILYKRWFVDFEFPDKNGNPYKSSGGIMVESEQGLIPENWQIISLNDLVVQNKTKIEPDQNQKLIDMASMPPYSISLNNYEKGDKLKTNTFKMKKMSFLYGSIRPYLGKFGISPFDGITTGTVHNFDVVGKDNYSLVASVVFSTAFNDFCIQLSHGTKMPIIRWTDFVSYRFAFNEKIARNFNDLILNNFLLIVNNVNQNNKLAEMRDLLLPKLMSGEIRLSVKE